MFAFLTAFAAGLPVPLTLGGVPAPGCHREFVERFDPGPIGPGPLRLVQISCVDFQSTPFGRSDVQVSPDGRWAAVWHEGSPASLDIAPMDGSARAGVSNKVSFRNFARLGSDLGTARDAFAWRTDSAAIWTVQQQTTSPGSWALSGLMPVSVDRFKTLEALPPPKHRSGPLDALMWIGNEGRALAQFGSRGGYYRPEHADPSPTFALIDAAEGRVLHDLAAHAVPSLRPRLRAHGLRVAVTGATGTILRDGRIKVVIQTDRWAEPLPRPPGGPDPAPRVHPGLWLIWTQGQKPREWVDPYPGDERNALALSPDGSKLLVVRPLQPVGVQIFDCRGCQPPPPPTAVSGPVAELVDLATRRVEWRVQARAAQFWSQSAPPAISPDGRFALIEMPPNNERRPIALIDMEDGRVVQRLAPSHTYSYAHSFGFTQSGRRVWVAVGNQVGLYDLVAPRRSRF